MKGLIMVLRRSPKRTRQLASIGENIVRWRKLQGLSASAVAERAYVTRQTLRAIENGTGTASVDSLFAVLNVLGITNNVLASMDPTQSESGRALIDEQIGLVN